MKLVSARSMVISATIMLSVGCLATQLAYSEATPIQVHYDDKSQLAIYFPSDQMRLVDGDAPVIAEDGKGNKVIFVYDKTQNLIKFKNECDSKESVTINFFGNEFVTAPCEEKKLFIAQHKPEELAEGEEAPKAVEVDKNEVIVDITMDGTLMAYTHGGKSFTISSGLTEVEMGDGKFVHFNYMDMKDLLIIKNACDSKEDILVKVFDSEFILKPCEEEKVLLSSAEGPGGFPQTEIEPDTIENVQEGREPISPFSA